MRRAPPSDDELEALREALNLETSTHKLACWQPPTCVPGVGWIAEVTLISTETYAGPRVDVILAPASVDFDEVRDGALEAAARVVEMGFDVAIELPLAETLGLVALDLDDPDLVERMTSLDTLARRRRALKACRERFAAVAERFAAVYGLRLPRSLIAWAALVQSADSFVRRGLEQLGRSGGGILIWFEAGGLEREPREGLDPRLDCRFRRDPPELVTIAWGDSDGLHYGLWFDDPVEPATTIVSNYARDSAETWDTRHRDMLGVLGEQIAEQDEPANLARVMLVAAIEWFTREAAPELAADPPSRWADVVRPAVVGSMGPALVPEHGNPQPHSESERYAAYQAKSPEVRVWIEQARAELDAIPCQSAFALVLGRELHWFDEDEWRAEGLELLVRAYRALGRDALAEIAIVHHRHRDLGSVGVF